MTPLPRWVLLAMLLALVAAHPTDHACVRLCHALNPNPGITGVCEHQQKLVLQSSGGRFPIQGLLRLCLTPCHGVGTTNTLLFDDSRICRVLRRSLIRRQGCSCGGLNNENSEKLEEEEEERRVGELEKNQLKGTDGTDMLKKDDEEEAVASADVQVRQLGQKNENTMDINEIEEERLERAEFQHAAVVNSNTGSPTAWADLTEETTIDWDLWCMNQCDHGKGGSACHCDIIP